MFGKILFATTASPTCDDAANVAFDLAKKNNSDLTTFHVLGIPTRGYSPFVTDVRTGETEELDQNYVELVLEEMRNTYEGQLAKYPSKLEAVTGVPHREILRKARQIDSDLIIMGAHARDEDVGASRYRNIVGSTMQKVARASRCPVLIISRPCTTCWSYFSNILFGTDFSKASDSAFQFALNVAKEIGCKLHIFHAVELAQGSAGQAPAQEEIEAKVEEARALIEQKYIPQMGDFDNYIVEIWEGTPYVEVLKYGRENKIDLIVMAHHTSDVDPAEALMGSTLEQVVLRASCPVVSVNRPHKVNVEPYGIRPEGE